MSRTKSTKTKSTKTKAESTEKPAKPASPGAGPPGDPISIALDESESAAVLGEYLAVSKSGVTEGVVAKIVAKGTMLTLREMAIAILVAEELGIELPVEFAPRFRNAYELARHARGCCLRRLRERAPDVAKTLTHLAETILYAPPKAA